MTRDGDTMAAWLREAADELDRAHALLDDIGVPRTLPGATDSTECTLAARIALLSQPRVRRAKAERLFAQAVAQGMHSPFALDLDYWGRDYAGRLLDEDEG